MPKYAQPLFVRIVQKYVRTASLATGTDGSRRMESTGTEKQLKVALRNQGVGESVLSFAEEAR